MMKPTIQPKDKNEIRKLFLQHELDNWSEIYDLKNTVDWIFNCLVAFVILDLAIFGLFIFSLLMK